MINSKLKRGVWGKVRVIEGYGNCRRLYVKRSNLKTYVVSTAERMTFYTLLEIDGEIHFRTLSELHTALNVKQTTEVK